jgi:tetratricopeptide (TPR) repeat protein
MKWPQYILLSAGAVCMRTITLVIGLILCTLTTAVYWQVVNYDFIQLDDPAYVTENKSVQEGISKESFIWAFTNFHAGYWIPMTWLSLMLDFELFGLHPGGYHLTNLFLHMANALLLFLILQRMTGAIWQSGLVAAFFSLHPLHVESVVWITERKDVLSTLFWLLSILTYSRYVERAGLKNYLLTCMAFALGLMAKPMLVTLPFLLLLLDYWPLQRMGANQWQGNCPQDRQSLAERKRSTPQLLVEKIPLLILAAVASIVTIYSQQSWDAVKSTVQFPLTVRLANAVLSYATYIGKMFWPANLAVLYPHPGSSIPVWQIVASVMFLSAVSIMVIRAARRYPYLLVGWFWYLGTLVPVIGLVQAGDQAMADRFTYIPLIGLFIMLTWGGTDLLTKNLPLRKFTPVLIALLVSALTICSWWQVRHWRDSISLFQHTLSVTENNATIHNNLGNVLILAGRYEEGAAHFTRAIEIIPNNLKAHLNLAVALVHLGKPDQAIDHYMTALKLEPNHPGAHNNLGNALVMQGKPEEAIPHFRKAIELDDDYAEPHNNLGVVLARQGRLDEAIRHFSDALRLNPDYRQARINLEIALGQRKKQQSQ